MDIELTLDAWLAVKAAVAYDPGNEVAFFGRATILPASRVISVDRIYIPTQEVGGAHAELEHEDIGKMAAELIALGEDPAAYWFWGHSHGTMGAFASSTDQDTLQMMARHFRGHAAGAVFNTKGEVYAWIAVDTDFGTFDQKVGLAVEEYEDPAITAEVSDAIKERVSKKIYQYQSVAAKSGMGSTYDPKQGALDRAAWSGWKGWDDPELADMDWNNL